MTAPGTEYPIVANFEIINANLPLPNLTLFAIITEIVRIIIVVIKVMVNEFVKSIKNSRVKTVEYVRLAQYIN